MATFTVTATVTLNFESEDGLVTSAEEAREEMIDYLRTGLNPYMIDITVTED